MCVCVGAGASAASRRGGSTKTYDDQDSSLKGLKGLDKGSERLAIEVVGLARKKIWSASTKRRGGRAERAHGLVENDDVGSSPGSSSENDLDLLSSRKTTHG